MDAVNGHEQGEEQATEATPERTPQPLHLAQTASKAEQVCVVIYVITWSRLCKACGSTAK